MKKQIVLIVVVMVAVLLGVLVYSTMNLQKSRVEVCMAYQGRTDCRTASGTTKEEALRTATDNACALLASGMTDTMTCGHTAPVSVKWLP